MASDTASRGIAFMDPTADLGEVLPMAPRLSTLDGKVMALFDTGKPNGDRLIQMVADLIRRKYDIKDIRITQKPDFTRPVSEQLMDDFVKEAGIDFAVVAVGD